MSDFRFDLTDEEKEYLKELAAQSIGFGLDPSGGPFGPPDPPTDKLREELGAFVTLKIDGGLRGCIGNVRGGGELFRTVWNMARSAAFEDPRFPPLTEDEFERSSLEISILSPIEICTDPERVEVGRHGLIVSAQNRSGLLLPQVPVEWGWDRVAFLEQTCLKAALPRDAWKQPETVLFWFEAVVF